MSSRRRQARLSGEALHARPGGLDQDDALALYKFTLRPLRLWRRISAARSSPEKLAHDAPNTERRGAEADDRKKSRNDARPPRHRSAAGEPGDASDHQGPVGRGMERRESERRADEAERPHEQRKR